MRAHASLSLGGRERAGREHLAGIAAAAASGELSAADAASWLSRLATVLRDEDAGICFRGLHDFCSTGSQITWLPREGGRASHLFTAASDPLETAYKRFDFGAAAPEATSELHAPNESLLLWRLWRRVALRGGLGTIERMRASAAREAVRSLRAGLEALESEALREAGDAAHGSPDAADADGGGGFGFKRAIEQEVALLQAVVDAMSS